MPANKTIGVIGLGSIGARHAKNLQAMGHRVIFWDPMGCRGDYGCMNTIYQLYDESEAVVIASPSQFHLPQIIDATEYANMHVFVEKPLGVSASDAMMMREVYARGDQITMVGNNLRFHSCVKKAKEWLAEGLIGKPLWASFCVAQHNTKYTDPVVLNWLSHECDLALYLLGPATVTAAAGNDQIMDICLLHEYGVPSTIHGDYVTKPECREFRIAGVDGVIDADLVLRTIKFTPAKAGEMVQFHVMKDTFDENYIEEMQHFIAMIDGAPSGIAATGQDGLATLELILEAQRIAAS